MKKISKIMTAFGIAFALTGTSAFAAENVQSSDQVSPLNNNVNYYYILEIKTADVSKAGTDSGIDIVISGANGSTLITPLDSPGHNDFERNTTHLYSVQSQIDLGAISSITIYHDGAASIFEDAAWRLESVKVALGGTHKKTFNINTWIGGNGTPSSATFN
ncbi:hypothetical protein I6N90_08225 [Paenibacillus sp. GSMTC-2017]|uniref:PLAT/LH2 domain-containing protein n=1 Tax=Paenibacillus sp. GSMTC-2017 TaxID=2794350 RepID=UPI0018D74C1A|nr:PLAT/LH2 domain-containing protein [Paenibacillus sp. GSMTC-2017]MBH5317789.1 hypothetical protein [Paenibacillus sp. GSMTC-2017]